MVLVQVVVAVQAGSDELSVVDVSVLVGVDDEQRLLELVLVDADIGRGKTLLELFVAQLSVAIIVHLGEGLAQLLNLVFGDAGCDQTQRGTLELY